MASFNHQFIQFSDKVIARYTKTTVGMLTGKRLDPHRPENTIDWLLHTPEANFLFIKRDDGKTELIRQHHTYEDEVIEIYSEAEKALFERLNRGNIQTGVLIVYEGVGPENDLSNVLSESQIREIAATKQLPALRKKIQDITSIHSLERILQAAKDLDRPNSIVVTIQEKINDISSNDAR
jgi:hypothetical protein